MTAPVFGSGSYFLNAYALPHFFTALLILTIAGTVLLSERGSTLAWIFVALCATASLWLFSTSFMMSATSAAVALVWTHVLFVAVCYIPFTMLLFTTSATRTIREYRHHLFFSFLLSVVFSVMVFVSDSFILELHSYWWGYFPLYGYPVLLYAAYLAGTVSLSLSILWDQWRTSRTEIRSKRFGTLLLAFSLTCFAPVDLLPTYEIPVYPFGFFAVIGFCSTLSFAIVRYRTTDFSPAYAAEEMMSTMDDPLIVCDLNGTIQLVNESCTEVFGFDREELKDADLQVLLASTELGSGKASALRQGRIPDNEEFLFRTKDGDEVDVRLSVSRLTDSEDDPVGIVVIARDIREKKKTEEQIQKLEFQDSVTNLPNRQYLYEEYEDWVESSNAGKAAILHLGFPDFSEIEHTIGPQMTETLLELIAERLQGLPHDNAELISWSNHEFVLFIRDKSHLDEIREIAREWRRTLREPLEVDSRTFTLRSNIGIALRPDHGTELETLLTRADLAREEAQKEPGKFVRVYEEGIQEKTQQRINIKNNLRWAINNQELDLVYHPIFPANSDRALHFEALLRWDHEEHGAVPPPEIIDMTEELDLMSQLGHWIIEQGCRDLNRINEVADTPCKLSINLSASQLHERTHLLKSIDKQRQEGHSLDNLIFEITETTAVQDLNFSRAVLSSIRERGCGIAVDDFGTGHSSIQYLMNLPIETLKIDKSFILDLFEQNQNEILVETMLFMAHQLDLDVVAEGVETERHRDFLISQGCDFLQGFLWTKPLELQACLDYVTELPDDNTPVTN